MLEGHHLLSLISAQKKKKKKLKQPHIRVADYEWYSKMSLKDKKKCPPKKIMNKITVIMEKISCFSLALHFYPRCKILPIACVGSFTDKEYSLVFKPRMARTTLI